MNFKAPRCKDTDPKLRKLRDVQPEEGIRCEVGRGECPELAVEAQDRYDGQPFYLCAQHSKEFAALAVLIEEMTPNQIQAFSDAITKAERG